MMPWTKTSFELSKSSQGQAAQRWCDYMSEVYFPLECSPKDSFSFKGALSALQLSKIGISKFTANALRTVRRRPTSGEDEVVFIFPTRNREKFSQFGLEDEVGPGEAYVLTSSEAYWTMIEDNSSNVTIKAPASCIRQIFPSIDNIYGRRGIANIGLVPIVSQLALQTLRLGSSADSSILKRAENNIIELICLMLETESIQDVHESTTTALSDVTLQRLSAFLSCHYPDPGLSPQHAATSLRVSVRYVHKIYQMNGTTFGRELLRLRLREADRMLRTPPGKNAVPDPISEIAYACGFCSQSHFSARYKEHFGITPGESRSAS